MKMQFNKIAGIGGVGTGMLFHTTDNAPLGRSESRLAHLSGAKDYCKLHIVFHTLAVLLAPHAKVYPIGVVGKDAQGAQLLDEMRQAGMDTAYMAEDDELPTMISICLQYPDGETCNFTASNSACNLTTPELAARCLDDMGADGLTIVAAIPEVQVESRMRLLRHGKEKGAFCVLSVPESEAHEFVQSGVFASVDLLALNEGEALALAKCASAGEREGASAGEREGTSAGEREGADTGGDSGGKSLTAQLYDLVRAQNPDIMLLVTCGKDGALLARSDYVEFVPVIPTKAVNTTGAGDAFLGGTIAGLAMGLPFQKGRDDASFGDSPLSSAAELGMLCAGMAVEVEDSIALHVNLKSIDERINRYRWKRETWFPAL